MAIRVLSRRPLHLIFSSSVLQLPKPQSFSNLRSNQNPQSTNHVPQWNQTISELGFSTPSLIQKLLEHSKRLSIEPQDFRRNVTLMRDNLGFTDKTVVKVFEELPMAFVKDPINVARRVEFMIGFGFRREDVDRMCCIFPKLLAFSIEGKLKPLFEEFAELGFSRNEVGRVAVDNPELVLGMEVGELSRCVDLVGSLKCRRKIKEEILCKGRFRAGIDVKRRIDFLCKYGLIRRDAFRVLYLEPRTILYGLDDIEKKIQFLLQEMGFSIEHMVRYPEYLGMNLEKQIIPRHSVIEYLRSKGGLGFQVDFKHLVRLNRLKFYNLFVKPYPECVDIFEKQAREREARPRHPSGLWKLFKPKKFPETEEDVRNMKMFMESLHQ